VEEGAVEVVEAGTTEPLEVVEDSRAEEADGVVDAFTVAVAEPRAVVVDSFTPAVNVAWIGPCVEVTVGTIKPLVARTGCPNLEVTTVAGGGGSWKLGKVGLTGRAFGSAAVTDERVQRRVATMAVVDWRRMLIGGSM